MKTDTTIGSWITMNHLSIAEIMAKAGFDWLCIDLEHTVMDLYALQTMISTVQAHGVKAYVRVSLNESVVIKRSLDAGADGIIVPLVNSAEEARKAVSYARYPTKGTRGVGLSRAQNYGLDNGFEDYRDEVADNIPVIVQIEHHRAIEELEEILAIEEIAGTFIGPYDLSGSVAKPGQFDDPEVLKLLQKYDKITAKHPEKLKGFHVIPPDGGLVNDKISNGYNFIAFSIDTLFLGTKCREQLKNITK